MELGTGWYFCPHKEASVFSVSLEIEVLVDNESSGSSQGWLFWRFFLLLFERSFSEEKSCFSLSIGSSIEKRA